MLRILCKSKIKEAVLTGKSLHYNGSIGIDEKILKAADIFPGEQVHVLNQHSGERLITYAIKEKAGSGKVVLYGPAARRGEVGDTVVVLTYCHLETDECKNMKPRVVELSKGNKITKGK
ncbi:MAG: aspartate 1-decarboxylase [Candidatus Omnitrophica bacterium]|nr:aspartate 1-decarboxylase [Candidatus Omnitrophota bacterium]